MNRVTVRRFDVVRTANIVAALYAVIVIVMMLVFLVPFMLIGGVAGIAGGDSGAGVAFLGAGLIGSLLLLVIGALFYAVVGWVMTAIMVLLYNWIAGRIGGLQLDVQVDGPWPGAPGGYPAYPAPYPQSAPGGYPGFQQPAPPVWPAPGTPGAPGHGTGPTPPPPGPGS